MNKKLLPSLNLIVVLVTISVSYYSNTGAINGNTMGSLSNEYSAIFTPAGYAFSIWGLIYIGLLGNAIFLLRSNDDLFVSKVKWLILANVGNIIWVFLWLNEHTLWSVFAMTFILVFLLKLTVGMKIGFKKQSLWIWWPISIYVGWIVVALVANVSAYLSKIEWQVLFSESLWTIIIMLIAFIIYTALLFKRRLPYSAYVGTWAFTAIAIKHWGELSSVQWIAVLLAFVLFVLTIWQDYKIRSALKESSIRAES